MQFIVNLRKIDVPLFSAFQHFIKFYFQVSKAKYIMKYHYHFQEFENFSDSPNLIVKKLNKFSLHLFEFFGSNMVLISIVDIIN